MQSYEILRVDLTSGLLRRERVPEELLRAFVGGKGLAAHYLATELPPKVDPLSPENLLIFMTGPASGLFPGTCRHAVVTKSPATHGFLDTYAGGWFAWELRKLGLLGIIMTGSANHLSYLRVDDDGAAIEDARFMAGLGIDEVDDLPAFEAYRVAAIGPAGENLVTMAGIGNNAGVTKPGRSGYNGRGGAGAVMGSKRLKAIALRGSRQPKLDAAGARVRRDLMRHIKEGPMQGPTPDVGTTIGIDWFNQVNVLPTRNFRSGSFEGVDRINHEVVRNQTVKREGCFNCPLRCGMHVRARDDEGAFPGAESGRIEYESIGLGASNTGNDDFSAIVKFCATCDSLGIDTMSAGVATAFTMDCAERGLVDSTLRFGDSVGQVKLAEDMAHRRDLGAVLADGVRHAADTWNVDEHEVPVMEVKGLEYPSFEPRSTVGMALAMATSDRGACHCRAFPVGSDALSSDPDADPFSSKGKALVVKAEQDEKSANWCLVVCDFLEYERSHVLAMLNAVGFNMDDSDFERLGARTWNLVRLLNLREGWTGRDDSFPPSLSQPLLDTGRRLDPSTFEEMKSEYYSLREWDEEGRPTDAVIKALDLELYARRLAIEKA
jgi:aldehyde:ferredoxin oxidoreductase